MPETHPYSIRIHQEARMKIAVTAASGNLGTATIKYLIAELGAGSVAFGRGRQTITLRSAECIWSNEK